MITENKSIISAIKDNRFEWPHKDLPYSMAKIYTISMDKAIDLVEKIHTGDDDINDERLEECGFEEVNAIGCQVYPVKYFTVIKLTDDSYWHKEFIYYKLFTMSHISNYLQYMQSDKYPFLMTNRKTLSILDIKNPENIPIK